MYVRWLDEIRVWDFRFNITYLPGARNPTDLLSLRCGFVDGGGTAPTTDDQDSESQQELF